MNFLKSLSPLNKLLFPAPKASYSKASLGNDLVFIDADNGGKTLVPCLSLNTPNAKRIIVYFHGNGEDIGQLRDHLRNVATLWQAGVVAVEYPVSSTIRSTVISPTQRINHCVGLWLG